MSAQHFIEEKFFQDSIISIEDELSTSAGSGDEEASLRSGSFSPPPGLSLDDHAQHNQVIRPPPGLEAFCPPPGLFLPYCPASAAPWRSRAKQVGSKRGAPQSTTKHLPKEPQVPTPLPPPEPREFDQAIYRKELSSVLRDLASGSNVAASVRRIRIQNVPLERQAAEFSDILTRAAEENRGVARRLSFAFAVGLAAGEPDSAFDRSECLQGVEAFFGDFEDLASEVPRLRNKLANELVPTLRTVFSEQELARVVPPDCRPVLC